MSETNFGDFVTRFTQDTPTPVECEVTGSIPDWLEGCLYRNGPGMYTFGPDTARHLYDGLSLIQKYTFNEGKVLYQNRMLESEAFKANKQAGRLVSPDFGHNGVPDPRHGTLWRYLKFYFTSEMSDNAAVNVFHFGDALFANSDTNALQQLNPDHLGVTRNITPSLDKLSIHMSTAHPHKDSDGCLYNIGTSFQRNPYYVLYRISPSEDRTVQCDVSCVTTYLCTQEKLRGEFDLLENIEIITKIAARRPLRVTFSHSFAMTENYVIFLEHPFCFYFPSLVFNKMFYKGAVDAMKFYPKEKTLFHVIHKKTGKVLEQQYTGPAMFAYHQINAYEDSDQIILDLCGYEDANYIKEQFLENLKAGAEMGRAQAWRFVIPLETSAVEPQRNLVTLANTSASALMGSDGLVHCLPEKITDAYLEFPVINYSRCNTQKYRFVYGTDLWFTNPDKFSVLKVDMETKQITRWKPDKSNQVLGEPLFVATPGGENEDDGVLLVPAVSLKVGEPSELIILDAKTITTLATITIPSNVEVPYGFHGTFLNKGY